MCSSMVSSAPITPAAPPSAETVWLRIGYTLETIATLSRGSASATAMAARSPAAPPPTMTTSWIALIGSYRVPRLLFPEDLAFLAAVLDRGGRDAAVVVLVAGAPAAALVVADPHGEALAVGVAVTLAAHGLTARRGFGVEWCPYAYHR